MRAERDRQLTDRILAPLSGPIAGDELGAEQRLFMLRAIVGPELENRPRGALADANAIRLGAPVRDLGELGREQLIAVRLLRGVHRHERVVRGLSDGGGHRRIR